MTCKPTRRVSGVILLRFSNGLFFGEARSLHQFANSWMVVHRFSVNTRVLRRSNLTRKYAERLEIFVKIFNVNLSKVAFGLGVLGKRFACA